MDNELKARIAGAQDEIKKLNKLNENLQQKATSLIKTVDALCPLKLVEEKDKTTGIITSSKYKTVLSTKNKILVGLTVILSCIATEVLWALVQNRLPLGFGIIMCLVVLITPPTIIYKKLSKGQRTQAAFYTDYILTNEIGPVSEKINACAQIISEKTGIPVIYCTTYSLSAIQGYFDNMRADSLKEALNLFEQEFAQTQIAIDDDLIFYDKDGESAFEVEIPVRKTIYENGEFVLR